MKRYGFDSHPCPCRVTQLVECAEKRILLGILTAISHSMSRTLSVVQVHSLQLSDGGAVGSANEKRRHHVSGANSKSFCIGPLCRWFESTPSDLGCLQQFIKTEDSRKYPRVLRHPDFGPCFRLLVQTGETGWCFIQQILYFVSMYRFESDRGRL